MADQILTQEEVELLLQTLGKGEKEEEKKVPEGVKGVEPLDPSLFERISAGRISGLELIFERWTSNLKRALTPVAPGIGNVYKEGTSIIRFSEFIQIRFSEFIQKLPVPSAIGLVNITPLRGYCFLIIDPKLVYSVVSSIFGGTSKPYKIEGKEFTRIELRIVEKMLKAILTELESAWNSIMEVEVNLAGIEMNPTLLTVSKPREKVILLKIIVDLEGVSGFVYFAIPEEAIKPYIELLKGIRESEGETTFRMVQALKDVPIKAEVILGRAVLTLRDVLNLKEGELLILSRSVREPVEVKVQGEEKFRAVLGQVGGSKAIKIYDYVE